MDQSWEVDLVCGPEFADSCFSHSIAILFSKKKKKKLYVFS